MVSTRPTVRGAAVPHPPTLVWVPLCPEQSSSAHPGFRLPAGHADSLFHFTLLHDFILQPHRILNSLPTAVHSVAPPSRVGHCSLNLGLDCTSHTGGVDCTRFNILNSTMLLTLLIRCLLGVITGTRNAEMTWSRIRFDKTERLAHST